MKDTSSTQNTLGPTASDSVGSRVPRHIHRSTSGASWAVIDPATPQAATTVVKRFNLRFTRFLMGNATALKRLTRFEEASVSGLPKLIHIAMKAGQLTMLAESMHGESLEEAIAKRRVGVDPAIAIDIVLRLAEGLIAMHAGGLVHGDIRTSTILVDADARQARFADWGIWCHLAAKRPMPGASTRWTRRENRSRRRRCGLPMTCMDWRAWPTNY
ncbi:MAG: hypothetical protein EXR39_16540 [Betaproteobacteria bacterium]|nr:hypothetical protein [Betaproteobacteria bacterium]